MIVSFLRLMKKMFYYLIIKEELCESTFKLTIYWSRHLWPILHQYVTPRCMLSSFSTQHFLMSNAYKFCKSDRKCNCLDFLSSTLLLVSKHNTLLELNISPLVLCVLLVPLMNKSSNYKTPLNDSWKMSS